MKSITYSEDSFNDIEKEILDGEFRGTIYGLPNSKYHSYVNYFSSSNLKYIYKSSALHFKENVLDACESFKQTDAMLLGSVVHSLLLTPDLFESEYFVIGKFDKRTKDGRSQYEEAMKVLGRREFVTEDIYKKALGISNRARTNPDIAQMLNGARCEVSYFWQCPFSGLRFRARVDGINSLTLIELKTAKSAKPSEFERQAYNMHYDLSAIHYLEGLRVVSGASIDINVVKFIVCETDGKFANQVYIAGDSFLDKGREKWLEMVMKLGDCVATDSWPGYSVPGEILELNAPSWSLPAAAAFDKSEGDDEWL